MQQIIYLDNNATTQPAPEVLRAMAPYQTELYGNPSSIHRMGQRARQALDEARGQISKAIGCAESEIVFTGGGTEAINTVIRGLAAARRPKNKIVSTTVEHSATRELLLSMTREATETQLIPVDREGTLDLDQLRNVVDENTALVTLIWANNETGVLSPVQEVIRICRDKKVPLHVDATQAIGKIPVDMRAMGIDVLSFAAHKFHGPKGVGAFCIRRGLRMPSLVIGGPQEQGRRGGTENVPGIVGMGTAAELSVAHLSHVDNVRELRDQLEDGILKTIPQTQINGRRNPRVPNTTNVGFYQIEAEAILISLSEKGICASAGAACSSGSLEPSPILLAMGIDPKYAHGSIRFSLSRNSTAQEIQATLQTLPPIIERLRAVLPV